jgi:hypothetical protein
MARSAKIVAGRGFGVHHDLGLFRSREAPETHTELSPTPKSTFLVGENNSLFKYMPLICGYYKIFTQDNRMHIFRIFISGFSLN